MKKLLILIAFVTLYSCGPKRLGCGPNRRCEVYTYKNTPSAIAPKNPETTVSGFLVYTK